MKAATKIVWVALAILIWIACGYKWGKSDADRWYAQHPIVRTIELIPSRYLPGDNKGDSLVRRAIKRNPCIVAAEQYDTCSDVLIWDNPFPDSSYQIRCDTNPPLTTLTLKIENYDESSVTVRTINLKSKTDRFQLIKCEAIPEKVNAYLPGEPTQ